MLHKEKQYIITTFIGALFLLIGLCSNRFIIIRPNRIINGTVMHMTAVFKGHLALVAALFLIFGLLLAFGKFRDVPWQWYTGVISIAALYVLWVTGNVSEQMTQDLTSAARTSLGIGFWFFIMGLAIIIESSIHYDGVSKSYRGLLVFSLLGLITFLFYKVHIFDHIGIVKEIQSQSSQFSTAFMRHMELALGASTMGLIIGTATSYVAYMKPKLRETLTGICNMIQVIPTLSMLGLLMIPLTLLSQKYEILSRLGIKGIGFFPAFLVLTGYTLLPIVNSTLSGLESIHPDVIRSAYAMGMEKIQVLVRVEAPLALPAILTGYKVALVQSIGNAILAGLVGGGGLGRLLFLGLAQSAPDLVIATALIIMMMALFLNSVLSGCISALQGYRGSYDYVQ